MIERDDIELAFIREFQLGGIHLAATSRGERQERIRAAIWRENRGDLPFHDFGCTYAEAFMLWSGKSLESRSKPRPPITPPQEFDDAEDDPETDGDEG